MKEGLNRHFGEDIRRLNEQLAEQKEKGKRKQGEMQEQISDIVQRNAFENG